MPRPKFPTTGSLEAVFADVPESVKKLLTDGFAALAALSDASIGQLLGVSLPIFSNEVPNETVFERLGKQLEISSELVPDLLSAVGTMIAAFSSRPETPEQFVAEARKAGLIKDADLAKIRRFADLVYAERDTIKQTLQSTDAASEVIPSLRYIEGTVDLRLHFENDKVKGSFAVALLHVDVDTTNGDVWFQVSTTQLERVVRELEDLLSKMKAAESFAKTLV